MLTLLVVLVVHSLRDTSAAVPNPPAFLVMVVVVSAFAGGTRPGIVSAAIAWTYTAYHFATPGDGLRYSAENVHRVVIWAFTMPAIAVLVGTLHRRSLQHAERKIEEGESSLAKERDFIAAVLDSVAALVVVLDPDGRIVRHNQAAERVTGYTLDDVRGKYLWDVVMPNEQIDAARPLFRRDAPGPAPALSERDWRTKNGKLRRIAWSTTPIEHDGKVAFLVCAGLDVTETRALEEQLRHSQKMDAFGQVAGGVAHDFNNLLAAILGYAGADRLDAAPASELREDLVEIRKAAERAAQLTRQLLAFCRKQVLDPEPLDLNVVVADMHKLLERVIGAHIVVSVALAATDARVLADRAQLEQVILNMVINARDAMPDGGRVTLATANVDLDAAYVKTHEGSQAGPHVALVVSDTGHGMDAATLERVFEPFFTTKEAGKGTGLGLSMAYGLVRQSGGHMTVESEPGRGATFRILLPRVDSPSRGGASD